MRALGVAGKTTLVFTRVMDLLVRGLEDGEEEDAVVDRAYWEHQASKASMGMVDDLLKIARDIDPSLMLGLTGSYVGLRKGDEPFNFVKFEPKKSWVKVAFKLPKTDEVDQKIDKAGFDALDYNAHSGRYRLRLIPSDVKEKAQAIGDFMRLAYKFRTS